MILDFADLRRKSFYIWGVKATCRQFYDFRVSDLRSKSDLPPTFAFASATWRPHLVLDFLHWHKINYCDYAYNWYDDYDDDDDYYDDDSDLESPNCSLPHLPSTLVSRCRKLSRLRKAQIIKVQIISQNWSIKIMIYLSTSNVQGDFVHWYPPKKFQVQKS